jgi:hypothetical protein
MSWTIILTSPQREKRLTAALNEAGFPAFSPLAQTFREQFGRRHSTSRPVLPGYVFAVIAPQAIHAFHAEGAIRFLAIPEATQEIVDKGVLALQISERCGEFDDIKPSVRIANQAAKPKVRNRRTRRIKRLMAALAEMTQEPTRVAA